MPVYAYICRTRDSSSVEVAAPAVKTSRYQVSPIVSSNGPCSVSSSSCAARQPARLFPASSCARPPFLPSLWFPPRSWPAAATPASRFWETGLIRKDISRDRGVNASCTPWVTVCSFHRLLRPLITAHGESRRWMALIADYAIDDEWRRGWDGNSPRSELLRTCRPRLFLVSCENLRKRNNFCFLFFIFFF